MFYNTVPAKSRISVQKTDKISYLTRQIDKKPLKVLFIEQLELFTYNLPQTFICNLNNTTIFITDPLLLIP